MTRRQDAFPPAAWAVRLRRRPAPRRGPGRAGVVACILLGIASPISCVVEEEHSAPELEQAGSRPLDVHAALARVFAGEELLSADSSSPLRALAERGDGAAQAWLAAFERAKEDATLEQKAGLVYLAGEACLGGVADEMRDLVDEVAAAPVPVERPCSLEELFDEGAALQGHAVRSLGRMVRPLCQEINGAANDRALSHLVRWIEADRGHLAGDAADSLLTFAPSVASRVRESLPRSRAWLLESQEIRRMEPYVDEVGGPRPPSASRLQAYGRCDPGEPEPNAVACHGAFHLDLSGDIYIDDTIAMHASYYSGENCEELATRYDAEIVFQNDTWDDGFGFHDACNRAKPFKRAVNALWLLEQSSSSPNEPGDFSGGVINWAYDYIRRKTPEIEGSCGMDGMATATTGRWCDLWPFCDERIELQANFHVQSVPVRAAVILHEARHTGGWDHDGDSCKSCDSRYSYRGANTIQVQWLAQFIRVGRYKTPLMVESALSYANTKLRQTYDDCPEMRISQEGWFVHDPSNCIR